MDFFLPLAQPLPKMGPLGVPPSSQTSLSYESFLKVRHIDQWNKVGSRNRLTHSHLTYNKIPWKQREKDVVFNYWCWVNPCWKTKIQLEPYLTPYKEISIGWIVQLNVKRKTTEHLGKNTGEHLHDLGVGKNVLNRSQKCYLKGNTDKLDYSHNCW